jgi:hypothetical protein
MTPVRSWAPAVDLGDRQSRNESAAVGGGAPGDHTLLCAVTFSLVSDVVHRFLMSREAGDAASLPLAL